MAGTLETLLTRIRDGVADGDELVRARQLVHGDARLPDELREVGLTDVDDLEGDAAGLLSVLGADDLFGGLLRDAVAQEAAAPTDAVVLDDGEDDEWRQIAFVLVEGLRAEAVGFEVTDHVMRRLSGADWVWGPTLRDAVFAEAGGVDVAEGVLTVMEDGTPLGRLVAEAVRVEGGTVDVAGAVAEALDFAVLPVAQAIRAEAGTVELAGAVAEALSFTALPVAEAVYAESGSVEVAGSVADALGFTALPLAEAIRTEAGRVDVTNAVLEAIGTSEVVPLRPAATTTTVEPALARPRAANDNHGWTWGAVLMAAIALMVIGASQLIGGPVSIPSAHDGPLMFASADEVVVEELDYGADVTVFQAEGDEGAVIIWVDEEA